MRVLLVACTAAFVLAGCSGGSGGLSAFLIQPSELPAACSYAPMDNPEMQEWKEDYELTSNPGSFNAALIDDDLPTNDTIVAAMIAYFDCGMGGPPEDEWRDEVFSIAMQFETPEKAMNAGEAWSGGCEDPWPVFVGGNTIAFFDIDYEPDSEEDGISTYHKIVDGIKSRTGATLLCEAELEAEIEGARE